MANIRGSVITPVAEGALNMDVEFRYEAAYSYKVVDPALFERSTGGNPPEELLDDMVTSCFMRAFSRTYPDGLSLAEAEKPDAARLMRNLKVMVDEEWGQFYGIALSAFSLHSFKADPAKMAQIRRLQSMPKTPEEMAQRMMGAMQAAMGEILASRQIKCPYCDSVVASKPDGSCPACGAPLNK